MSETHELGGSAVVVDRATPKARVFIFYSLSFYCRLVSGNCRVITKTFLFKLIKY